MNGLEEQADNAKAREPHWKSLSWRGTIPPTSANDLHGLLSTSANGSHGTQRSGRLLSTTFERS